MLNKILLTFGCRIGCPRARPWSGRPAGRTDTGGRRHCPPPEGSHYQTTLAVSLHRGCQVGCRHRQTGGERERENLSDVKEEREKLKKLKKKKTMMKKKKKFSFSRLLR